MMRQQRSVLFLVLFLTLVGVFGAAAHAVAATYGQRTLLFGSVGEDVALLQGFLNRAGYLVGAEDGIFGSKTGQGVKGFQQDYGLVKDGVAGKQTYSAIDRAQAPGNTGKYTVHPGDTLYWIAQRYGTTVDALRQANALGGTGIQTGDYLSLPGVPVMTPWAQQAPADRQKPLAAILQEKAIPTPVPALRIIVDKSDRTLSLYSGNTPLKSYSVDLGDTGAGDKYVAGDHKTPEGKFFVSQLLVLDPPDQFLGTRWMRLSYPGPEDAQRGLQQGLINRQEYDAINQAVAALAIPPQQTALGGGVGIHGGSKPDLGANWTFGCIGLSNQDVEEFYGYVQVGTPVIVTP